MKRKEVRVITNLYGEAQVRAILDGIRTSAFQIKLQNTDAPTALLMLADRIIFSINLQDRTLSRHRDAHTELVYTFRRKQGFFDRQHDEGVWKEFQDAIHAQGDLGGMEALSTNLFRRAEIETLIQAIRGMVFKIHQAADDPATDAIQFEDADVFRFNRRTHVLSMVVPNGNGIEVVYAFKPEPPEWFWSGTDRDLLNSLNQAIEFYHKTIQRVRMSTYRAMFGRVLQDVIVRLAAILDEAEAEARMLEKVDSTQGGSVLHPQVAELIQKDLDQGEEAGRENAP